jgi:hypothetical protein
MTLLSTTTKATAEAKGAKDTSKHPGNISKGAKAAVGVKAAQGMAKHPGIISKVAKAALAVMGVETAAKHPRVVRVGLKAAKPVARGKVRKRSGQIERFGDKTREVGEALLVGSALIAQGLGLVERPKPRPAGPPLASGVVIGAGGLYFLQRWRGRKHRSEPSTVAA